MFKKLGSLIVKFAPTLAELVFKEILKKKQRVEDARN